MTTLCSDEEVIRRLFASQPEQCFETLYKRYAGKVYRRCLSMTRNHELAQDFTHDIFLKMYSKLDAFQQRSSFSTWLYAISFNYCSDQIRLAKRLSVDSLDHLVKQEIPDPGMVDDMLQVVQQSLEKLSKKDQALLQLKYEDGLTVEEIAGLYNIKGCAVKMRLKRSRARIYQLCVHQNMYS